MSILATGSGHSQSQAQIGAVLLSPPPDCQENGWDRHSQHRWPEPCGHQDKGGAKERVVGSVRAGCRVIGVKGDSDAALRKFAGNADAAEGSSPGDGASAD